MRRCLHGLRLADGLEYLSEPRLVDVEGLVALDSWEVDDAHDAAVVFVETGNTARAFEGSFRGDDGALADEFEITLVGRG